MINLDTLAKVADIVSSLTVFAGAGFALVQLRRGGLAVVMWRKLRRWTGEVRRENAQPSWAEWFQWLAERLQEFAGAKELQPAYSRYSSWRPRS